MQRWRALPIPTDDQDAYKDSIRLNSLGSLFFFAHFTLKKERLTKLHWQMCQSLETEDLHLVFEIPMGHFKTTVGTEAFSMWGALPFTSRDEFMMRELGYNDEWIRWMKAAHDQNARTLITHEIEARAISMGKAVDEHYLNNDVFRFVFSDILPDNSCTWNDHTKFHKRTRLTGGDLTTGTFEYRGAGQALQGIHVTGIINDDSVGKAAQSNMLRGDGTIVEDIYRWWKQSTTRFDSANFTKTGIGKQLVIGNRWGHADLNSLIRKNHPEFKIESHSAEGGCCKLHPLGKPIFPEEFSMERLQHERATLGAYDYAHFMLNQSILPEECIFKPDWLRYFRFKQSRPDLGLEDIRNILLLEHEVYDGKVIDDLASGGLTLRMIVDLAHAKKRKRCDHVVLVAGYDSESDRIYLLEVWAEPTGYAELVEQIYKIGKKWGMRDFWLETVGAQNILKFYLEERNAREKNPLYVNELPYDNSENAKVNRIEALEPAFKNGQIWCHRSQKKFIEQYNSYPAGLVDVLDTLGYLPQTLEVIRRREVMEMMDKQRNDFTSRVVGPGGY
jgi:hypothetical protein